MKTKLKETMLSTADNPFNPFTEWEKWYAFDVENGYNTSAYLARIVVSSYELSEEDQILELNNAIDEILELNLTGNYIKVTKD